MKDKELKLELETALTLVRKGELFSCLSEGKKFFLVCQKGKGKGNEEREKQDYEDRLCLSSVKVVTVNRESKQVLVGDTKGWTRCGCGDTEQNPACESN